MRRRKSWARAGSFLGSTVELCHNLGCSGDLMTVYFHVVSSTFHHNIYALRLRYHPWISPHKTSIFGLTPLISGSRAWCCCSRQRAHTLRTPKHRSHYRTMDGGVADTTRYIIHRRLRIGKMWETEDAPGPSFCRCTRPVHLYFPRGEARGARAGGAGVGRNVLRDRGMQVLQPRDGISQYGHDATRLATFCPLARGARGCASGVRQN